MCSYTNTPSNPALIHENCVQPSWQKKDFRAATHSSSFELSKREPALQLVKHVFYGKQQMSTYTVVSCKLISSAVFFWEFELRS